MEQLTFFNYLVVILEICAAILGTMYYSKTKKQDTSVKYLVFLLWINVFFEVLARFRYAIKSFESLFFLKGTLFEHNIWIYNISIVLSYILYITYFRFNLVNKFLKKTLMILVIFFAISTISNLIVSDVFFKELSTLTDVLGSLILLLSVLFYFYEVMQSDKVLIFYKVLPFYIAVGALVFHLIIAPIDIYFEYVNDSNIVFRRLRGVVLYSANIFMYTCYSIGFIVCLKRNKSY